MNANEAHESLKNETIYLGAPAQVVAFAAMVDAAKHAYIMASQYTSYVVEQTLGERPTGNEYRALRETASLVSPRAREALVQEAFCERIYSTSLDSLCEMIERGWK